MSLEDEIKKRATIDVRETRVIRSVGLLQVPKSLFLEVLRRFSPEVPEDKYVQVEVKDGRLDIATEIDEYNQIEVSWDKSMDLTSPASVPAPKKQVESATQEIMETKAMSTTDLEYNEEFENRRFRYFYALDGVFSKGDFTYEQLRNLNNAGGFIGDFSGPERDVFSNTAGICDEFVTGNGVIMRVKDAE